MVEESVHTFEPETMTSSRKEDYGINVVGGISKLIYYPLFFFCDTVLCFVVISPNAQYIFLAIHDSNSEKCQLLKARQG